MHHPLSILSHSCRRQRVNQTATRITQGLHSLTRTENSELCKNPVARPMDWSGPRHKQTTVDNKVDQYLIPVTIPK